MISERRIHRTQVTAAIVAVLLLLVYWFGYRTLSRRVQELNGPLGAARKQLVAMARTNVYARGLAASVLQETALQMQLSRDRLLQAGRMVSARVAWDELTRQRLVGEFQLLEFDRQRYLTMADLRTRAASAKVTVADAVWAQYPDYDATLVPASLHWALLATAQQILLTAIHCQVGAISNLTVLPTLSYPAEESGPPQWHQFRVQLELAGPAAALERFLRSLPVRPEDGPMGGVVPIPGKTQAFFVDRMLMKNVSANPDVTALEVVISAFCAHPQSRPET
ncbi:hypothetical protein G4L39_09290 [Limisphaera ngatamarikiensis]|uniref:Uncharacterized protein n=1 Tax=Limisphaera ngatamarikiensis TaxID=1324935 RepID=A0A6M1RQB8_9BACT|nr:hypothetical protein [Limisphaera ngatamarikiensis]NGO39587.1 hypothetical protein [Limisphaera ngatamarikiensis]